MKALVLCWLAIVACAAAGCGSDPYGPLPGVKSYEKKWPRPAFLSTPLADLEKPIEAAIAADEERIRAVQQRYRWDRKREPLIPNGPEAVGWKPGFDEVAEYRRRTIRAYEQHTADSESARPAALEFLRAYLEIAVNQWGDLKRCAELADAAIAAGSQDPLVATLRTRAHRNAASMDGTQVVETLLKLQKAWGDGDYPPPAIKFLAAAWIAVESEQGSIADAPSPIMRRLAYGDVVRLLVADSGTVAPDVLLWFVKNSMAFDSKSTEHHLELFQACLSDPAIDPWITHVVGGDFYTTLAWEHRGSGWAHTVTEEGWKKFHEYLPKAGQHYRRAWALHPELAEPASKMITVTMGGGATGWTEEDWLHAALLAQADYDGAYNNFFNASMPRWGGSQRRIAAIAELCIATDRWDLGIPNKVGNALWYLNEDNEPNELAGKNPNAARIAKRYVEGYVAAHGRGDVKPDQAGGCLAQMTSILVTAGNFETARSAFEVSPRDHSRYWGSGLGVPFHYSEGLAYAMTGPAREHIADVHRALSEPAKTARTVTEVANLQDQLARAQELDSEERAKPFFDIAGRMLGQLATYAAGDWVDLTFEPGLDLWLTRCAETEIQDERTIRLIGRRDFGALQLRPLTRFAPPFIIEAEARAVSGHDGGFEAGILIGTAERKTREQRPSLQSISVGGAIWGFLGNREYRGQPGGFLFEPSPVPTDGFMHIGIRRYEGETQFFGMHSMMGRDADPDEPMTDFISFGDTARGQVADEIVLRNLRIRRAPLKPKMVTPEHPDNLLVLQEFVDFYPECPEARTRLANALALQGKPAEALDHLDVARKVSEQIRDMHRVRATALCALGNFGDAALAFQKELEYFPTHFWARVNFAWLLATSPDAATRQGTMARQLINDLPEQRGDPTRSWSYLLTAAVIAAELGDFEKARRFADDAAEIAETDFRKDYVERVRKAIQASRPYRMPAAGEAPPQPSVPKKQPAGDA